MGCGRSRHRSPSPALHDGSNKENNSNNSSSKQRGGKRQKLADKAHAKSGGKRETDASNNTPTKTTNGKMGGVKSDWQLGGERVKNDLQKGGNKTDSPVKSEGGSKRQWQLEEAVDTPPETVMAVYRSSVPASERASLNPSPSKTSSKTASPANGSLLNGSHKGTTTAMPQDVEMRMEVPEKTPAKDRNTSGNSKPVHITSSQLEFFKMLDEKIEKGPDYESDDD